MLGKVKWNVNWVAFMDCLLQIHIIGQDSRALLLPTGIQKLTINPILHQNMLGGALETEDVKLDVFTCKERNLLRCGGIEIRGLQASPVARRLPPGIPVLESYQFVPHLPTPFMEKVDMARFCVQLGLENLPTNKVLSIEIDGGDDREPISELIASALSDLPLVTAELNYLTPKTLDLSNIIISNAKMTEFKNCFIVINSNCLNDKSFLDLAVSHIQNGGFLIARESTEIKLKILSELPSQFQLIALIPTENETIVMFQVRIQRNSNLKIFN